MRLGILTLSLLVACSSPSGGEMSSGTSSSDGTTTIDPSQAESTGENPTDDPSLGASLGAETLTFAIYSAAATHMEVWIYAEARGASEVLRLPAVQEDEGIWAASVEREQLEALGVDTVYYGFRAWGPNWPLAPGWEPGSLEGFVSDVDEDGNRFNPNKLLIDPYARELSHDPRSVDNADRAIYATGEDRRQLDSAPVAPKGIVVPRSPPLPSGPQRPLREEIIYEVHVRGLTMNDPAVPEGCRGTYAGAVHKAAYLADLGVTAIELLPIHETDNDRNDVERGAGGDNYWGYSTLAFFAPDRRYACDRSPGGPTREFRDMVTAFHAAGIKVFIDVVYNHTAESGLFGGDPDSAVLLSLRGLDNATYYELAEDPRFFVDNTEVGANVDVTQAATRQLILDSLTYAHQTLGVDGFRFDLASVLGNTCSKECFAFDADDESGLVRTIAAELPARPRGGGQGVDLIAEPWAIGPGTYQLGSFGTGWAEWNDLFRDALRRDQNAYGTESVTPGVLAQRISGSPDVFGDDGRGSDASINYIVSHDGFSLHDLYACETRDNDQGWPYGPSAGGSEVNYSSAWGGNTSAQHRAARSGLTLLMMSAGVPMMTGGDEMLRNVACNNNAYNVDSVGTWLDWSGLERRSEFFTFVRRLLQFRRSHPVLWSEDSFYAHATWLDHDALELDDAYLNSPDLHFLAFRLDATSIPDETIKSLYVAYNGWTGDIATTLPLAAPGASWYRVLDTASEAPNPGIFEPGREPLHRGGNYPVAPAAVAVFIER